jgi:hypothetical protein
MVTSELASAMQEPARALILHAALNGDKSASLIVT